MYKYYIFWLKYIIIAKYPPNISTTLNKLIIIAVLGYDLVFLLPFNNSIISLLFITTIVTGFVIINNITNTIQI